MPGLSAFFFGADPFALKCAAKAPTGSFPRFQIACQVVGVRPTVVPHVEWRFDVEGLRQAVTERLNTAALPAGIERPKLGPVSTGLGEVFHYVVRMKGWDVSKATDAERVEKLTYLRTVHDWSIRPTLRTVPGVAEVNAWGGFEKQYQVRVDPERLIKHGLTFQEVTDALERNNQNVGGGGIRRCRGHKGQSGGRSDALG